MRNQSFCSTFQTDQKRQPGQGGVAEAQKRDLRAQLLQAEAAHFSQDKDGSTSTNDASTEGATGSKRQLEAPEAAGSEENDDIDAKRRRILEETRDIDADSDGSEDDSSEEDRWGYMSTV